MLNILSGFVHLACLWMLRQACDDEDAVYGDDPSMADAIGFGKSGAIAPLRISPQAVTRYAAMPEHFVRDMCAILIFFIPRRVENGVSVLDEQRGTVSGAGQ